MILTERQRGWVEGVIDTESCLRIIKARDKRNKRGFSWSACIEMTNTNPRLCEYFKNILNRGNIVCYIPKAPNTKPVYVYRIYANVLRELLPQITLVGKEQQRILIIEALNLIHPSLHDNWYQRMEYDKKLENIYLQIRMLNSNYGRKRETREEREIRLLKRGDKK